MTSVVVPYGARKTRLALAGAERAVLSLALLETVLAAATAVGSTVVVTGDRDGRSLAERLGATVVDDPGGGQGEAVATGLRAVGSAPALVVNADLPLATADDLLALASAAPALVAARDGTTNALALSDPSAFRPLYGPGSASRFAALGFRPVELPRLAEDVDTTADVERLGLVAAAT